MASELGLRKKTGLLWCNPAYGDLDAVLAILKLDKSVAVVIAPDWRDEPFFPWMWEMAEACYYYRPGTLFFELAGKVVPLLKRWGVWAVKVRGDGQLPKAKPVGQQRTKSSRRRYRLQQKKQAQSGQEQAKADSATQ